MAEKVIFEFHAENGESGYGFGFKQGMDGCMVFAPFDLACCRSMFIPGMPSAGGPRRYHRLRDKTRRRIGETLDFFERMYDDLYGGGGSGENED